MPWGARSTLPFAPPEQFFNILPNAYTTLYSMRTADLHTAVFRKWANRTYYHTSYLTQPRALPNCLGLVSCAERTAILGRVCKFLHPRVTTAALWLCSTTSVKIQNSIFEATKAALISSEGTKKLNIKTEWLFMQNHIFI